jgi:hypothetical protein
MRRHAIGMMYDESSAIAQSEKIAFAAIGLARSSRPGSTLRNVHAHTARSGVRVSGEMCARKPPSGRPARRSGRGDPEDRQTSAPWSRLNA